MSREKTPFFKRFGAGDRVVGVSALGMLIVLTVLTLLSRAHLQLIRGEIMLFLPLLLAFTLLGWGVSAIVRRVRNRTAKVVVGGLLALALFIIALFGFSYMTFVSTVALPQRYNTVVSPGGAHRLVVLRRLDNDEARAEARHAARIEADPDAEDEMTTADWSYQYTAAPIAAGIFYRDDADVEGEAFLGYSPDGTLMVEWNEDETEARFFVKDPGVGEGGECVVRF